MNKPRVEEDDQSWNKYNAPHTTGKKVCVWMEKGKVVYRSWRPLHAVNHFYCSGSTSRRCLVISHIEVYIVGGKT